MKKIIGILLSIILLIIFPLSLQNTDISLSDIPKKDSPKNIPTTLPPEEKYLAKMTNEEKVGQLFMFGIDGTTVTEEEKTFLQNNHIGGILLLGKNITDEQQLKQLIQDLQINMNIPMFISIDQEGGGVSRIKWNDTLTKAEQDIQDYNDSYNTARERGIYLKEIGINMNLAPVVEYITKPSSFMYDRVYKGTEEEVIQKGEGAVKGYKDAAILSVIKHYPGHGNDSPDSHYSLPVVNISNDQWDQYIQIFSIIIQDTDVDALMVGHIKFTNIDTNPSSLSYEIITKRLIQDLNYNGLIISDDMGMKALDGFGTPSELAEKALSAGNDILIYSTPQIPVQQEVYNYILQEVNNGNINIDNKVLKILKIKIEYNILKDTL